MKHVLIIDHTSLLGGAEYSLESIVQGMDSSRYRYTVVLPGKGPFADRLRNNDVKVDFVKSEGWRWWVIRPKHWIKFFITLPLQLIGIFRWVSYLKKTKPDIVHLNINRLVEPLIAAKLIGIPSVMHFRDIPSRIDQHFMTGMKGFFKLMNLVDAWIANSNATYDDIKEQCKKRLYAIPNGIDLSSFDLMAESNYIDHSGSPRIKIAMVALLVPWKNHIGLLELASIVTRQYKDIEFLVVGTGEAEYIQELKQLSSEKGVENNVTFVGYKDNIPKLLSSVNFLVHTTEKEPFGRVFIEAMSASKPIVAFNSGGASEIVIDGETGILIPSGDVGAMAEAVLLLMDDPALIARMGKAGRKRVEKYYSIEKHCNEIAKVYESLL